jgi:hypothetical protein
MSIAQTHTFLSLLESDDQKRRILIPKIQRDFAQGREDKASTEIRNRLVGELIAAIARDHPVNPVNESSIDLGLIFGAADKETGVITLFDGQQRMTTLFLLHWYLAWRLGKKEACATLGRFSYDTRLFSRDFCRALVNDAMAKIPSFIGNAKDGEMMNCFHASSWFCTAWLTDPSVKGMIVMLETIHDAILSKTETSSEYLGKMWERIQSPECIRFTWLLMGELGLNEDLYIKLNSRGKTLSNFEKFKAWLEDNERGFSELPDSWQRKLDTTWTDLFWKRLPSAIDPENVSESMSCMMMGFFVGSSLNETLIAWNKKPKEKGESKNLTPKLIEVVNKGGYLSRTDWEKIFQPKSVKTTLGLLGILDSEAICNDIIEWSNEGKIFRFTKFEKYVDSIASFIIDGPDVVYTERLLFYGLARYLVENVMVEADRVQPQAGWNKCSYIRWMRLVRNLAVNSNLGAENYANAITAIASISPESLKDLDAWLMSGNEIPKEGLDNDQREEEQSKAKLRCAYSPSLETILHETEDHWFLRGQIHFLIELSRSEGIFDLERFRRNLDLIKGHFDGTESDHKQEIRTLQLALLAQGDYLPNFSTKYGFASDLKEWRSVFKTADNAKWSHLVQLFAKWEIHSLEEIIAQGRQELDWTDWRRWFLEEWPDENNPGIFKSALDYGRSCRIAWSNEGQCIVLVSNVAFGSYNPELRTYCIFEKHLKPRQNTVESKWNYDGSLRHNSHAYVVTDQWRLELRYPGNNPKETGFELRLLLKDNILLTDEWEAVNTLLESKTFDHKNKSCWATVHRKLIAPDPAIVNSALENALRELEKSSAEYSPLDYSRSSNPPLIDSNFASP